MPQNPPGMSTSQSVSDLLQKYGLTEKNVSQQMKEQHRQETAINLGGDWELLASFIGISHTDVEDIKAKYRDHPQDQRSELFRKWNKTYGSEATYAKMIDALEKIGNRQLTEKLLDLLKEDSNTKGDCDREDHSNEDCDSPEKKKHRTKVHKPSKSKSIIFTVITCILVACAPLIYCMIHAPTCTSSKNKETEVYRGRNQLKSVQVHTHSTIKLWSPQFYNSIECGEPVGHDLPGLHGLLEGREEDIREVVRKLGNTSILNINGAPGFGTSTVAIYAGYSLLKDCTPVRYVDIEELPQKKCTHESSKVFEKIRRKMQTTALTSFNHLIPEARDSDSSNCYIKQLTDWSKVIKHTTVLILDNADDILTSTHRQEFTDLIKLLVHESKLRLHIVIVSYEKLLFIENFDRWMVRELSQRASVQLLTKLAPGISESHLDRIAALLEGCPLALKVVGNILNIYGQSIAWELEHELQKQPIGVLDKVSNQRNQFRAIMDLLLSKIELFRKCGYTVSLFPGSFSRDAGTAILSDECLKQFEKQSLLDEYFNGYQHRYKMHRLIGEYLKEKVESNDTVMFMNKFCTYYTQFLLKYSPKIELDNLDEHALSSESRNIDVFGKTLMTTSNRDFSPEELAALLFLTSNGYIQEDKIQLLHIFKLNLKLFDSVCELVHQTSCKEIFFDILKHSYIMCKCSTIAEYSKTLAFQYHQDCSVFTTLLISLLVFWCVKKIRTMLQAMHKTYVLLAGMFAVFLVVSTGTAFILYKITLSSYGAIIEAWIELFCHGYTFVLFSINFSVIVVIEFMCMNHTCGYQVYSHSVFHNGIGALLDYMEFTFQTVLIHAALLYCILYSTKSTICFY